MADAFNSINVTPERLREVSPEFRLAAQDSIDLIYRLNQVTNSLVSDMYGASLVRSPEALEGLWNRWRDALSNLANAMETVANNLDIAAGGYEFTDQNAMPNTP